MIYNSHNAAAHLNFVAQYLGEDMDIRKKNPNGKSCSVGE